MTDPILLEPNHHFLDKFQHVLKEHLLRQIEKLKNENYDLVKYLKYLQGNKRDNDYKKSFDEYKNVCRSIQTYEKQINLQTNKMISNEDELKTLNEDNYRKEKDLIDLKKEVSEMQEKVEVISRKDKELSHDLEHLKHFEEFLKNVQNDQIDEIEIQNHVTAKCKNEQDSYNDVKQKRDLIIFKLMEEIFNFEDKMSTADLQMKIKSAEKEDIDKKVEVKSAELDSLSAEHKRTIQSWNSIITQISEKDKLFFEIVKELEKIKNETKVIENEIVGIQKQGKQEMEQNERMTLMLNQILNDLKHINHRNNVETENFEQFQTKLYRIFNVIEQTGKNLDEIGVKIKNQRSQNEKLEKKLGAISKDKSEIDGQLFAMLQTKLVNNKIIRGLVKEFEEIQEQNRNFEIELSKIENLNGSLMYEIETKKKITADLESYFADLRKQEHNLELDFKKIETRIKQFKHIIELKHKMLAALGSKLSTKLQKSEGLEISEMEKKIQILHKDISDMNTNIKQLKLHWIQQQNNIVTLSDKREKQLHVIQLLKKQKMILEQKNLKIDDEIESYSIMEHEVKCQINNYQHKIVQMNQKIADSETQKEEAIRQMSLNELEYDSQLKDIESNYVKLEQEIETIEDNLNALSIEIVQLTREVIAWESKMKELMETRDEINKEQGKLGKMGAIKAEIQRMSVRYSQLKKVAEKLSGDLEFSVKKRESIINANDLIQKKSGHKVYSEIYFNKKYDQLKSDVTQCQNKIEEIQKFLKELNEKLDEKKEEIDDENVKIDNLKSEFGYINENYCNLKTDKQKNLDFIILKQSLVKFYDEMLKGKYRYLYKTEKLIRQESDKQKLTRENLLTISNQLMVHFSQFRFEVMQISNVLCLKL